MAKGSPAIVHVMKYVLPGNAKYGGYIKYMDRDEAKRSEYFNEYNALGYDGYHNYMENPFKSTGLFSKNHDQLDSKQKMELKTKFERAEKNKSPMWQSVFSFDNKWLEEQGLYDPRIGYLNESSIKEAVHKAMETQITTMGFGDTTEWSAAIHYNTDNIHVHVALIEMVPTREWLEVQQEYKAKIPKRTLRQMKSTFSNSMINHDRELARISYLIRTDLADRSLTKGLVRNSSVRRDLAQLMNELPNDKRLWKYGMNEIKNQRPLLDSISKRLLTEDNPEGLRELHQLLDEQVEVYKRMYGEGTKEFEAFKEYKTNQMHALYSRLGNGILKELVRMKSSEEYKATKKFTEKDFQSHSKKRPAIISNKQLNTIKKALRKSTQDHLNEMAHKRLQAEQKELNKQHERDYGRDY